MNVSIVEMNVRLLVYIVQTIPNMFHFQDLIDGLRTGNEIRIYFEYEDDRTREEYCFKRIDFVGRSIILYAALDDFTVGIVQDEYTMTRNEALSLLWDEDISDFDTRKVYVKKN